MSEVHIEEHSSPIKTPKQLIIVIILSFVVPIALIVMLSQLATTGLDASKKNPALTDEAVAARIKPVGQVAVTDPNAPKVEKSGKEIFDTSCGACHLSGALNAPKIGDKSAWGKLIARGLPSLTQGAIKGIRNMPARGGADVSDAELARAIVYMANQSGGNLREPEVKPAAAPAKKK
jgi:cytochrome c5